MASSPLEVSLSGTTSHDQLVIIYPPFLGHCSSPSSVRSLCFSVPVAKAFAEVDLFTRVWLVVVKIMLAYVPLLHKITMRNIVGAQLLSKRGGASYDE